MSDVIEGFLVFASVLAGMVTLTAVFLYAAHRWDQWGDQKRDALAQRLDVAECPGDVNYKCRCVENDGLVRAYEIGVQDSMLRATQYERILRDLIAELRDENEWHFTAMANRAEARLRKATGDE